MYRNKKQEKVSGITTLIFDLGGVVQHHNEKAIRMDIAKAFGLSYEKAQKLVRKTVKPLIRGEISERDFWKRFSKKAGKKIPEKELKTLWMKTYKKSFRLDMKMIRLVKHLKKAGYKVAGLTNTIKPHYDYNRKLGWFRRFPLLIASNNVGMRKPEKRMYRYALKRSRSKPENTVFIDDIRENVDAAKSVGIKGVHFKSYSKFVRDLRRLGVRV